MKTENCILYKLALILSRADMELSYAGVHNDDGWEHHKYRYTLKPTTGHYAVQQFGSISSEFSQGMGHTSEPTKKDIFMALVLDAQCVDQGDEDFLDFEDFCSDLGYDNDSRAAERIYNACIETANDLKAFLADSYKFVLEHGRMIDEQYQEFSEELARITARQV